MRLLVPADAEVRKCVFRWQMTGTKLQGSGEAHSSVPLI
uniref:Uncharacterized protein n=1 Tax=Anguilla anguilla TaxID=7936 RepID=A0A0E9QHP8_ANGAN